MNASKELKQTQKFKQRKPENRRSLSSHAVEDDTLPAVTISNVAQSTTFISPVPEDGDTDYGLDFTSSRLLRNKSGRCSTLRRNNASSAQESEPILTNPQHSITITPLRPDTLTRMEMVQRKLIKTSAAPVSSTATSAPTTDKLAKQRRRKQLSPMRRDKKFVREVLRLQTSTEFLVPRLPFSRLVRELIYESSGYIERITVTALEALQTACEMYITQRLQDAYMLTLHRGRVTLTDKDMALINFLRTQVA